MRLLDNIQLGDVVTLKLNSGEELIAKVHEIQDAYLALKEPVSVAPGPQGVGLIPSLFTAEPDQEVRINTSGIAMIAATEISVKSKYTQATSKIVMPEKKIIMG